MHIVRIARFMQKSITLGETILTVLLVSVITSEMQFGITGYLYWYLSCI